MPEESSYEKLPKGIRLRNNGRYIADVCVNGVRKTATCSTLAEAISTKRKMETALRGEMIQYNEKVKTAALWTLADGYGYCLNTRWRFARNKKNLQTTEGVLFGYFGEDTLLKEITPRRIDEFTTMLVSKYKAGTVNLYLSGLSTVLSVAYEHQMLERLPKISRVKNRAKRIRYLSESEELMILDYFINNSEMRESIIVLLDTGLRCCELLSLTSADVDRFSNMVSIWKSKTDKPRSIPMTERVRYIILERAEKNGDKLFDMAYYSFVNSWTRMRKDLGYANDQNFVPHILRHTCCSRLVQRGADLIKVMNWMGHSNISTTMIYAHLSPNALNEIKALLEK